MATGVDAAIIAAPLVGLPYVMVARQDIHSVQDLKGRKIGINRQGDLDDRLSHAVLLFNDGFANSVLVVGGNKPGDVTTEAETGRSWLVGQGLPVGEVFAEPKGSTTFESLRAAASFMRAREMSTAFLVSDPWHNLRIRRMASDLGIRGYVSADFRSAAKSQWTRFQGYVRETFAYLYYRILRR